VGHRKLKGKTFTYFPLITRAEYTRMVMKDVKESFFGGSGTSMIKFFVDREELSREEIDELIELINSK
jgi:predicted transcriptional regulator